MEKRDGLLIILFIVHPNQNVCPKGVSLVPCVEFDDIADGDAIFPEREIPRTLLPFLTEFRAESPFCSLGILITNK